MEQSEPETRPVGAGRRRGAGSIVGDLWELQTGLGKRCVARRKEVLIKKLVASPCRKFRTSQEIFNRGSNIFTCMHADRLFLQQSLQPEKEVMCYSAYPKCISKGKKKKKKVTLKKLFSFPCNFKCKDLVIWSPESPISTENLLRCGARHSTSMLYLENSKYLVRRCCLTGKLEDRLFLSDELKFNEISSDSESDLIALKSTRLNKSSSSDSDSVFTIAVFTSPPLKFLAMFEVKTSLFGKKVQDTGVSQGLIFVRYYDGKVVLFPLDIILQKCIHTRVEDMDEATRHKIGVEPYNLPLNADVNIDLPPLFSVESYQGELVIGGNPWHFIKKTSANKLEIRNFLTQDLVTEFEFSRHFAGMEVEHLFFHPDDSRRVVHVCNNKLQISVLRDDGLKLFMEHKEEATHNQFNRFMVEQNVTRSGRAVQRSLVAREAMESQIFEEENTLTHDLTISLDSESDIFAIFAVKGNGPERLTMMHIHLYDNTTGELLRVVPINDNLSSSLFNVTCNLTLDGVNIFAEVRDKTFMYGHLLSLVEMFD